MNKTALNSQKEKHSMLSLRRATSVALPGLRLHLDFYPRSPCGERLLPQSRLPQPPQISIHALLAESDRIGGTRQMAVYISIHALLAESDTTKAQDEYKDTVFLSTLSLRRATIMGGPGTTTLPFLSTLSLRRATTSILHKILADWDFYPRSPCGERRHCAAHIYRCRAISIHALLAESDLTAP